MPQENGTREQAATEKEYMKGTEEEVLQFLRQLLKCCGMKHFNELIMNGMGQVLKDVHEYAAN